MEHMIPYEVTAMEVTLLSEERLFQHWLEKMPETRKRKVASLRHAESQRLSLGVGILLYQALRARELDPFSEPIAESREGKPYLPEHPGLHISLSHGGDWALCAVGTSPLGCDVEEVGRGDRRIAERFFHLREKEYLRQFDEEEAWQREFTRIWTRKESYLKADGRGLSLGMETFQVLEAAPGIWYEERTLAPGIQAALCVWTPEKPAVIWRKTYPVCPPVHAD